MSERATAERSTDPGVPEALPRVLIRLRDRLGVESLDRLWIFPPSRRGRRERGLVVVSEFLGTEERRSLITVSYVAEHTGRGVTVAHLDPNWPRVRHQWDAKVVRVCNDFE